VLGYQLRSVGEASPKGCWRVCRGCKRGVTLGAWSMLRAWALVISSWQKSGTRPPRPALTPRTTCGQQAQQ
jgi:hypothetical protein